MLKRPLNVPDAAADEDCLAMNTHMKPPSTNRISLPSSQMDGSGSACVRISLGFQSPTRVGCKGTSADKRIALIVSKANSSLCIGRIHLA